MVVETKILPPAELLPRVVPRDANYTAVAHRRRGAVLAAVIEWKRLVVAVWQLREDEQYTGELPAGLSSQQFWAKVTRQARALGGEVGVRIRGRQWWAWSIQRGQVEPARWEAALERLQSTGECWFDGELSTRDKKALREAVRRAKIIGRVRFVKGEGAAAGQTAVVVVDAPAEVAR